MYCSFWLMVLDLNTHYGGHCAHKIANLCKSAAKTDFGGGGDTFKKVI